MAIPYSYGQSPLTKWAMASIEITGANLVSGDTPATVRRCFFRRTQPEVDRSSTRIACLPGLGPMGSKTMVNQKMGAPKDRH